MARLNLTLDSDTFSRLDRHARSEGVARSAVARELLIEALNRMERQAKLRKLARDYARGRDDVESLLVDFEIGQIELLDA